MRYIVVFALAMALLIVATPVYSYKLTAAQQKRIAEISKALTCEKALQLAKRFEGFDFSSIVPFAMLYANERANIEITRSNNTKCYFAMETRNAKIYKIQGEFFKRPTLLVFSNEETAIELSQNHSVKNIQRAISSGKIKIKGANLISNIKIFIGNIGLGIMDIFGNLKSGKFLLFPSFIFNNKFA